MSLAPATAWIDAVGGAKPKATTVVMVGGQRVALADLDGLKAAMDRLNEQAKIAKQQNSQLERAFGDAWIMLYGLLSSADFEVVMGELAVNRKTLARRKRRALMVDGRVREDALESLRNGVRRRTPERLLAELGRHRIMVGSPDTFTETDWGVLFGVRPPSNIVGRGKRSEEQADPRHARGAESGPDKANPRHARGAEEVLAVSRGGSPSAAGAATVADDLDYHGEFDDGFDPPVGVDPSLLSARADKQDGQSPPIVESLAISSARADEIYFDGDEADPNDLAGEDDEEEGTGDGPDGRPCRTGEAAAGADGGGNASLSPHAARALAAPTDARRSSVAEGGAAPLSPATTPPPVRHAAARASGPAPVQATFAELYQQAERVRRFADQVQRGEVGAEHLARVMAAIGGGA